MAVTRVILADDHTIVVEGLAGLLKPHFKVLRTVGDGRALVAAAVELRPDVVVTDISMPLLNGLEATRQIKSRLPRVKVIVLTVHAEPEMAVQAFRAGAAGYLLKVCSADELILAIEQVTHGRAYLSPLVDRDLISILIEARAGSPVQESKLTTRQREVLQLIAEGKTMKEVASILHISPRTAESHKYEMMEALGVQTTAALIQYALHAKMVA